MIVAIYRPHSGSVSNFTAALLDLLQDPRLSKRRVCIVGDLNINLVDQGSQRVGCFMDSLRILLFSSLTKPTIFWKFRPFSLGSYMDKLF